MVQARLRDNLARTQHWAAVLHSTFARHHASDHDAEDEQSKAEEEQNKQANAKKDHQPQCCIRIHPAPFRCALTKITLSANTPTA